MEQKNNSGTLFRYTGKKDGKASSPDYRGNATINGKQYQMAAWVNKSKAGQNYLRIYFFDVAKDTDPIGANASQAKMPIRPVNLVEEWLNEKDDDNTSDLPF